MGPQFLDDRWTECQVRDEMPVHDIDMDHVGTGIVNCPYFLTQTGKVSRQDRRGNQDITHTGWVKPNCRKHKARGGTEAEIGRCPRARQRLWLVAVLVLLRSNRDALAIGHVNAGPWIHHNVGALNDFADIAIVEADRVGKSAAGIHALAKLITGEAAKNRAANSARRLGPTVRSDVVHQYPIRSFYTLEFSIHLIEFSIL